MRHTATFLAVLLAASVAHAAPWPGSAPGGTIDSLGDLAISLCTSGKILERQGGPDEWACINTPIGSSMTFNITGDSGTSAIVNGSTQDFSGGAGILTAQSAFDVTISTASEEAGFLKDNDAVAHTCTTDQGSMVVHNTEALAYCDGADALRYAAFSDSAGLIEDFSNANDLDASGDVANASHTHTVANLSDTTATAAELTSVTDTGNADAEHVHTDTGHPVLAGHIDAATEIAAGIKTVAAAKVVMALAQGTDGTCVEWDATNGLVDAASAGACGAGGASLSVEENDVEVDATVDTLNFLGADFDLAETPEDQVQIVIAAAIARVADASAAGDISGSVSAGYNIDAQTVGLTELGLACNEAQARIIEFDSSGVASCKIAIQTALVAPAQYEVLVVDVSGNWVDGKIDLAQDAGRTGTLPVGYGGTGNAASLTAGGVLIAQGTSAFTVTARQAAGQLLVGKTTGQPQPATLGDGNGIVATAGDGTLSIAVDLNTTGDGAGADGSGADGFSGLEFTATGGLALLQGCDDTEGVFWIESTHKWACGAPTTSETNTLTTMGSVADDQVAVGASAGVGAYKTIPDCDDAGDALQYDVTTNVFTCNEGLAEGGVVTGLIGDDNVNPTTAAEVSIDGIAAGSAGAGIGTDSAGGSAFALSWLPAVTRNVTWGDASQATIAHVFSLSGADDPTVTYSNGGVAISGTTIDLSITGNFTASGGVISAGSASQAGSVVIYDATGGENVTIDVPTAVTSWTFTLPAAVSAGSNYVMQVDTSGNATWLDIDNDYANTSGGLGEFASGGTSSSALADILSDEVGTGKVILQTSPTIITPVIAILASNTLTLGTGTFTALTINAGAVDPTFTFGSDSLVVTNLAAITLEANSVSPDVLTQEIRSMAWNAGSWSTDGTECEAPAELTINSGPVQYGVVCPMGTSETDGFIYGSTPLMDGFRPTDDLRFMFTAIMDTDSGAGTFHGSLGIQCVADRETVGNSWGTEADVDFVEATDVQWDLITANLDGTDATVDAAACAGAETLWWRLKMCDVDASPSTNCSSSTADTITDLTLLSARAEYGTDIGD